jgi:predicted SAM-dependent methyltransferase
MKLDIACGANRQKGFKGVDIIPGDGVDFVYDLEKYPWTPFGESSCDEIYIGHYAEYTKDLMKFMDEVWRVAENGAKVSIVASHFKSVRAYQDPTAVRALTEATWAYFNKEWRMQNGAGHYPVTANFSVERVMLFFNPPWDRKSDEARQFAQEHYWNVVSGMLVELKAIK